MDKNTKWIGKYPAHRSVFVIYPKDIEIIIGLPPHLARQFLFEMREAMTIAEIWVITPRQFCKYTGIDAQTVEDFINES